MILFLVVFSLALSSGLGAPTAVYKFVKCNPDGDQANCITHQSANMEWSSDLPTKLSATEAQYLEAEPVEDERNPEGEEDVQDYEEDEEDEGEYMSPEEGESPVTYLSEDGSGDEGSAFMATPVDTGSEWKSFFDERKPAEESMKQDEFLPL